ncbi:MAG: DUF1800 family protein [Roseococcus sp.]|nr:DUF1800 family protein [Roseococcus sp.]
MEQGYHHAAMRFGYGPRLGEAPPPDVLAWLDAQTRGPGSALPLPEGRDLPYTLADGLVAWRAHEANPPQPGQISPVAHIFQAEQRSWLSHLLNSAEPFRDRLTSFWVNHFTVAARGGFGVSGMMGPFLREAVRPRLSGRFVDLLLAVAHMPPLLYYLDQVGSIGPNSPAGRRTGRGLNENLAREILELHTLSPLAGYGQSDVTELARLMTGWSVERHSPPFSTIFRPNYHEPGAKSLLGQSFAEGPAAFAAALRFLGEHPATYRHLALRLTRHFVADDPPPGCVAAIEAVLRETGGDLGAASRALVRLPEAWAPPLTKFRSPHDYVLALHRAVGGSDPGLVQGGMNLLGQPLWDAPQPNGWADRLEAWCTPEPMMQRLDYAHETAGRFARLDPMQVLETALGPLARAETLDAARRAGSQRDAISLIFASPEMQCR